MGNPRRARLKFDTQRLLEDMALRGWEQKDLAAASGLSAMTISRFLRAERQTVKTAARLAGGLGYSIRRYLVTRRAA